MNGRKRETPLTPIAIKTEDCTLDMKQRIVAALPLFQDLSAAAISAVEPMFRELGYAAGERIENTRFCSGHDEPDEPDHGLLVVGAGLVKLLRFNSGRIVIEHDQELADVETLQETIRSMGYETEESPL